MKSASISKIPTRNFWTMLAESSRREEKPKTAQVIAMPKRYEYNETTARIYANKFHVELSREYADLSKKAVYIRAEGPLGTVTIERPMDARGSCWSVCGDLVRTVQDNFNKGPAIVIAVEIVAGIGRFKA
jgi:hypothetical protein